MSFFQRNKAQSHQPSQPGLQGGIGIDTDSSSEWFHTSTPTAAAPSSSSFHDEYHFATAAKNGINVGALSTTTTTTAAAASAGFLHPESLSSKKNNIFSSNWAQERSSQQLDLENEVLHNNSMRGRSVESSSRGCCQSTLIILIKGLHIFNVTMGMAMLGYGILVQQHGKQQLQFDYLLHSFDVVVSSSLQQTNAVMENPTPSQHQQRQQSQPEEEEDQATQQQAMAAVLLCLMLGSIHLLTSGVGSFSLFFCSNMKWGYIMSAWTGPYLTLIYLSILVALLFDSDGFILYLEEHAQVMYLNSNVVENATRIFLPVAYTLLVVLGILESMRYCVLMNMHNEMVARDEVDAYVPRSSQSILSSSSSSSRSVRRRNKVSANDTLTQALLQDSIDAEETVRSNNSSSVDPNWWDN